MGVKQGSWTLISKWTFIIYLDKMTRLSEVTPAPVWGDLQEALILPLPGWVTWDQKCHFSVPHSFFQINKSSFLRVFRGLIEIMFVKCRGQGLSYINRGYYYIGWLISNYKLYKGRSKSRCSLLSFMQIKKTTPREENVFPVSFFFSHL